MAINHGNKPWQHWVYYWLYHGLHPIHTQKRYPETPQSQHIFGAGRMGVAFKALKSSAATRSSWAMEWLWLAMDSPYIFLSYSHDSIALKKAIYIYVGMIGIWLGLFLPMIFPVYSYHSPCWTPTAHLAALHFRLGAPTLGPRRSQDPTTNRIAIVTVFCINIVI